MFVFRRQTLLVTTCIILTALSLVVQSVFVRLILFSLLLLVAGLSFFAKQEKAQPDEQEEGDKTDRIFPAGSLFEATMGGMREGLLVVNKDMRVVASNPAAHKLFNASLTKLDSQRLTELTRNPAIYSAFLDGLKGVESSGVKVETHGPERQVFDLRVVPIGGNGKGPEGALGVFFDITRTERL